MIYELKNKLVILIKDLYNELDDNIVKNYLSFKIVLSKSMANYNEKYINKEFIIYNLFRQECELSNSLIICLAHHIDFFMRGETRKDKDYMKVYTCLLHRALKLNMIDFEELKRSNDYKTQKKIQKALDSYWECRSSFDYCIIEIYKGFEIKDLLKKSNFNFNKSYLCWEKRINKNQIPSYSKKLLSIEPNLIIKTRNVNKIVFIVYGYICLYGNTYNFKSILKNNNYVYKDKRWIKKIKSNQYLGEKKHIESLICSGQGIKITMEY